MKSFTELVSEAVKKNVVDKEKILHYQLKQYHAGNKITWAEAKKFIEDGMKALEKEKKKNIAAAKRAAKKLNTKKSLTDSQFKKMIKSAGDDFKSGQGHDGGEYDLSDVAWDIAGSMMYDPEVNDYVRKKLAKSTGQKPEDVKKNNIQQYIADNLA